MLQHTSGLKDHICTLIDAFGMPAATSCRGNNEKDLSCHHENVGYCGVVSGLGASLRWDLIWSMTSLDHSMDGEMMSRN